MNKLDDNPWLHVDLDDYENHMRLDTVQQLQTLNRIMKDQLKGRKVDRIMICGIAGGNGLEYVDTSMASRVYGLDVNPDYLVACEERFHGLAGVFKPVLADMTDTSMDLPKADMVIADLFLEYVGYQAFTTALERIDPRFVSCVIQVNQSMDFVSDSPYARVFDQLDTVYHHIDADSLIHTMKGQGYDSVYSSMTTLPNGKALCRCDFERKTNTHPEPHSERKGRKTGRE